MRQDQINRPEMFWQSVLLSFATGAAKLALKIDLRATLFDFASVAAKAAYAKFTGMARPIYVLLTKDERANFSPAVVVFTSRTVMKVDLNIPQPWREVGQHIRLLKTALRG